MTFIIIVVCKLFPSVSEVALEGGTTSYDDSGHILAKFKVPTDTISTKNYRCDVTGYTVSTEVGVAVEIIGQCD